jgi:hypothetical protein
MNEQMAARMKNEREQAAIQAYLSGRWSSMNHADKHAAEIEAVADCAEFYGHALDDAGRRIADARAELDGDIPTRTFAAAAMPAETPEQSLAKSKARTEVESRRVELSQLVSKGPERIAHEDTVKHFER